MKNIPQLIVALDVDSLAQVRHLMEQLDDAVEIYKVGSQLFTSCGPAAVKLVGSHKKKVFLDLKFHDIPNTVTQAVRAAVNINAVLKRSSPGDNQGSGIFMLTVHACGGFAMMQNAVLSAAQTAEKISVPRPFVLGVTVLTSEKNKDGLGPLVLERALAAKKAGCDGVVASCQEIRMLRKELGEDFLIVTPGIRASGHDRQDQERVATPQDAIAGGSNFLVVGRPITKDPNPRKAAQEILKEMQSARR